MVSAWWSLPFIVLLFCIAILPLVQRHFWDRWHPLLALGLGALVAAGYTTQFGAAGRLRLSETGLEYFEFIALIGALYIVCGGIALEIPGHGSAPVNTAILLSSLALSNILGTTGASLLLIRPYLRLNQNRLRPFHVVFFIFIVCNSSGALSPVGNPPLFIGFLNGVPFTWTFIHGWAAWLFANALLLAAFFAFDSRVPALTTDRPTERFTLAGKRNLIFLGAIVFAVFCGRRTVTTPQGSVEIPVGALLMVCAAALAYRCSDRAALRYNRFAIAPLLEVAILFAGIFATMMPALELVAANSASWNLRTPLQFYFVTGIVSAFLDNAPAYLNSLSAALGLHGWTLSPENVRRFADGFPAHLRAIGLGSVFFGACTYIGNGPNLMVKALAESAGAPVPGFFAYIVRYTLPVLLPLLILTAWIFLR